MSTPTSGDLLLVNRGGVNYQIDYDDMSTLQDNDLLLVNRAGVNYQIAASDLDLGPDGLIVPSVDVLTPVNGAGLDEGTAYTPLSSAYVSTDSTPIRYRYFPELIETISGGPWVDENNLFDGSGAIHAELTGAADSVSQFVFTPHSGWIEGETDCYVYGTAGGTIEILDDAGTVLRTYSYGSSPGDYAVGIVRSDQKIRFTSNGVNESIYAAAIGGADGGAVDYVIPGRVSFEFTDDTDLDKMVAPIIMTDENGDVKVPTTSTVDSTTTIPGVNKSMQTAFTGNGNARTYTGSDSNSSTTSAPLGDRVSWVKADNTYSGIISDSVRPGQNSYLKIDGNDGAYAAGPFLTETQSEYNNNSHYNQSGTVSYVTEHAVSPKVLDIVTYTGNGASLRQIPHNLGCQPGFIVVKQYDNSGEQWYVWHIGLNPLQNMHLNQGSNPSIVNTAWKSWPTRDHFYVGSNGGVNGNAKEYVAYIYAADTAGKIKCGEYNGLGYGGTITALGNTPIGFAWCKNIQGGDPWYVVDENSSSNGKYWKFNSSSTLNSSNLNIHTYPGKFSYNNQAEPNQSGQKYLYMAVAKDLTGQNSTQLNLLSNQDLEYFTAGTQITSNAAASGSNVSFATFRYNGNGGYTNILPQVDGSYFFDTTYETANKYLCWVKSTTNSYRHVLYDSERKVDTYLSTIQNDGEYIDGDSLERGPIGVTVDPGPYMNDSSHSYIAWNFLARPQFFDVQKYAGDGGNNTIQHDLGVEPGFIMIKSISSADSWWCYHAEHPNDVLYISSTSMALMAPGWITADDSSFSFNGNGNSYNRNGSDYVAYLFAKDTPYVKSGKYTATGGGSTVNVGFKPRWVLIKKSSSSSNWFIIDKTMQGNGQHLWANRDEQVQTGFTYTFTNTGFSITEQSSTGVTDGGSEYVYIAIADESEGHPPSAPSSSTVLENPDVNGAVLKVTAESFDVGATASAPALEASITSVAGSDSNTLLVDGTTGTWMPGLYAKGSETTTSAPSADEIVFTSSNAGTTAFSGVDATLSSRTWTLESGPSATGPWTVVDTYVDYDALASQDGATPWSSNKPALAADTFYRVKVQYDSTNAESVESVYSTFKTSA